MPTYLIDKQKFSEVYITYFPKLVRFSREYVISSQDAENIVQDLFAQLWENREILESVNNLNAFLFVMVKNRCIDFCRKKIMEENKNQSLDALREKELKLKMDALLQFNDQLFQEKEMEEVLNIAISHLPERCREVFIMSRLEEMKYEDISLKLNISVNTVQNHIIVALRKLKTELKDYLTFFLFII